MPRPLVRTDTYQCPEEDCRRWCGEHMNTRLLARHRAPGDDPLILCDGSYTEIHGLPHQVSGTLAAPVPKPTVHQEGLFPITGNLAGGMPRPPRQPHGAGEDGDQRSASD